MDLTTGSALINMLTGFTPPEELRWLGDDESRGQYVLAKDQSGGHTLTIKCSDDQRPRTLNFEDPDLRMELLADFAQISVGRSLKIKRASLLEYVRKNRLKKFGTDFLDYARTEDSFEELPNISWPYPHHQYSVQPFLEKSAFLYWLLILIDAIDRNQTKRIENWIKFGDPPAPYEEEWLATFTTEEAKKGWKDVAEAQKFFSVRAWLDPSSTESSFADLLPAERLRGERWEFSVPEPRTYIDNRDDEFILRLAKKYLAAQINNLVSKITLVLTPDLVSTYRAKDQLEAMYLALYQQATGISGIKFCPNPGCPTVLFQVKGRKSDGGRKPRNDKRTCGEDRCRKWCSEHGDTVRAYRKSTDKKTNAR